jgi:hypothetical protein
MNRQRRPLGPRRSRVLDLDPVELAVELSKLPPHHPLVAAARSAVEVAELRRERQHALAEASKAISAGTDWRRVANEHVPHEEIQRRRQAPGPSARIPTPREPDAREGDRRESTGEVVARARRLTRDAMRERVDAQRPPLVDVDAEADEQVRV